MTAGGTGNALEDFRSASSAEQECLFFVALSRARDRLTLYAATRNAIGAKHPISEFIGRLGSGLTRDNTEPGRSLPPPPEEADVPLAVEGVLSFNNHQLSLYGRGPRRFFYTHVLQAGGRRIPTGFTQVTRQKHNAHWIMRCESIPGMLFHYGRPQSSPKIAKMRSRVSIRYLERLVENGDAG